MDGKEDRARDYPGQNAGKFKSCPGGCKNKSSPDYNRPARTDVEGCCWWGRGVIQTTGVCNFGKLNYYVGKRAFKREGASLFPDIDFCKNPQAICEPNSPPSLKWIAGLFYWLESVEPFSDKKGWKYMEKLKNLEL
jgi:hypothetical protein